MEQQRSRSGLYRSGQRKAKQAARQENARQDPNKSEETIPHVGKPLDGHQYGNEVIEEQAWADKAPTREEQQRRSGPFNDKSR